MVEGQLQSEVKVATTHLRSMIAVSKSIQMLVVNVLAYTKKSTSCDEKVLVERVAPEPPAQREGKEEEG